MKKLYRRIISLMIALTLTAANIPENLLLSAAYGEDAFIFSAGDMVIDDAVLSDGDTVMDDTMILDGDLAFDDTVFTDEDVYPDDTVIPGETLNFDDTESLNWFHRTLRRIGVINALKEAGAKEGSTVRIDNMEFDYVE